MGNARHGPLRGRTRRRSLDPQDSRSASCLSEPVVSCPAHDRTVTDVPRRSNGRFRRALFAPVPALAVVGLLVSTQITAGAATCTLTNDATGFSTPAYGHDGGEALLSDAAVSLGAGRHIVEYVDSTASVSGFFSCAAPDLLCWAQSGWGFGTVGPPGHSASSGPSQRPYFERNDDSGYLAYFDTSVGVHCCSSTDVNNTSTSWNGLYDTKGNPQYVSYFNNQVGSGNIVLGRSGLINGLDSSEAAFGEEGNSAGTCATVNPVYFTGIQIKVASTFSPWTSGGLLVQPTIYYGFNTITDYTAFSYQGP
jgi:hypothetical protein